jgi:hypothetical protein
VTVNPGARIEWRIVMDYTGARTDLTAMGEVLYQPIMSNADNAGVMDSFGPFRNGGVSGFSIPGTWLSASEGNNPGALASYGRVMFAAHTMSTVNQNTMTTFRHDNGSNNAPPGHWMRIAGEAVVDWPQYPLPTPPGGGGFNSIGRGVSSMNAARFTLPGDPNPDYVPGTSNLVIFRMATLLANDNLDARTITISSHVAFLRRAGGTTSTDDTRYMTWQAGDAGNGSVRVGVEFQELTINVVPAPGAAGVLLVAAALMPIRRRRCFLGGSL